MSPFAQHPKDVYDDAMVQRPKVAFGKVAIDAYRVVLIKGQGKVPYNPQIHDAEGRRSSIAIDFRIAPLDATRPVVSANTMLDWTREFTQVVRPSILALAAKIAAIRNIDAEDKAFNPLRELNGLFVKYEWVLRPDNKPGETWQTLCFRDVYPDEASCKAAAAQEGFGVNGTLSSEADSLPFPDEPAGDQEAKERAAYVAFLLPLWMQSGQDREKFLAQIRQPPYSKFFTEDSEEVKRVMVPF